MVHGSTFDRWDGAVLGLVVLLGIANIPLPFTGDQSLFALGSEAMSRGAVLYRDFWDVKQPGIYFFYLVGGSVFGFNEFGFHVWELFYFGALALIVRLTLGGYVNNARVRRAIPLLVVGIYYAGARPFDLGQVEVLVSLPLYLAWYFATRAEADSSRRNRWLVCFGAAAGSVALFKHLYILIAFAWMGLVLWRLRQTGSLDRRVLWTGSLAIVVGLACVIAPVTVYFAVNGQLDRIWWTYVTYAPGILEFDPRPLSRLINGFGRLVLIFAPLLLLAAAGLPGIRKHGTARIVLDLVVWLIAASFLLLLQSWWSYHFLLLLTPAAILGVLGLDRLMASELRYSGRRWAPLVAMSAIPLVLFSGGKLMVEARNDFGLTADGQEAIRSQFEPVYQAASRALVLLTEPDALEGDIYVFGNPLYIYLSGRHQAIPINGWSTAFHGPEAWEEVRMSLAAVRPPYVFIEPSDLRLLESRAPAILSDLRTAYDEIDAGSDGTWYRLKTP